MILTAREDIDAPIETVFAQLTDGASHERAVMRRGGEVRRIKMDGAMVPGAVWKLRFPFRGKERKARVELTEIDRPNQMSAETQAGGMTIFSTVDLVQLGSGRTRMGLKVKLKPGTLSARLVVQSLKLTRASVERRVADRFRDLARDMEARARS